MSGTNGSRHAVFLDRDGVLNATSVADGHPIGPRAAEEFELLPGVREACDALHDAGYLLIVVTNQPEVARGTVTRAFVDAFNARLADELPLDAILTCPHDDADGCDCRKPQPGLLLQAAREWNVELAGSFMVGDRWKDVEAGRRAGCATVFVDHGYVEPRPDHFDASATGLAAAAAWILGDGHARATDPAGAAPDLARLHTRIFADGADLAGMVELARNPLISGFTTNPTLMRAVGITDYERFAKEVLAAIPPYPISFEVFADEFHEMERQALKIAAWGDNVYVKIPVTNTRGDSSEQLVRRLAGDGVKLNVTALLTLDQVRTVGAVLTAGPSAFVSVFAGRIADTGRDPLPLMAEAVSVLASAPNLQLIWASPREILNIFHADSVGCHVITVTHDMLKKLPLVGRDLAEYSLDTVKMFHGDAASAGYVI